MHFSHAIQRFFVLFFGVSLDFFQVSRTKSTKINPP